MSERHGPTLDWSLAERVALRVAERHRSPGDWALPPQGSLDHLVAVADERVRAETRLEPPTPARVRIVDRAGWIRANLTSFRSLVGHVGFGRRAMSVQLGTMLGWMSGRVLGQYDVLLGDQADDAVCVVGPNLVLLEQQHGFDAEQFRLWVILHELTHRSQFEGVPWMSAHYRGLIDQVVAMTEPDPSQLLDALKRAARDRGAARDQLHEGGIAALLATDEQRQVLRSIGALMSLLEGHGDIVMDRAATDLLPDAPRFSATLRQRREQQHPVMKVLLRWIGVTAKLEQYAAGERFVERVEEVAGSTAIDHCWVAPDCLPTWDEVRDPDLWLDRTGAVRA